MSDEARNTTDQKGGVRFDPTVNLGHILTFLGFLLAGVAGWSTLDKRIVVLEEGRKLQAQIDVGQSARFDENTSQIKEVLTRLDRQVERLNDRLDKSPGRVGDR
ncbi:hypothetical protein [Pseudomonas sp.]|uniref:hypothetical protein n=1 Tax=Pseudomonas sp. TaxID=306 RepID=UPI00258257B5|nr:hypothetical protein [Pseudomonas sp.]